MKGEVKVLPLSNKFILLRPGSTVYVSATEGIFQPYTIEKIKRFKRWAAITFRGITEIEKALLFRDSLLYLPAEEVCLEDGEFFHEQIIGLSVVTTGGMILGKVEEILATGSNDVYVVTDGKREYLIPAIADVVKGVDLEGKTILIEVMEGMLD